MLSCLRLPHHFETVTLDWDLTMLKLCHGIGPIWYKEEDWFENHDLLVLTI